MPRMYISITPDNIRSAQAAASRIPAPINPRPSVSHVARRTALISSQVNKMSLPKPTSFLPDNALNAKQLSSVSARILERRKAIVDKLGLPSKRLPTRLPPSRTASTSSSTSSSAPYRRPLRQLEPSRLRPAPLKSALRSGTRTLPRIPAAASNVLVPQISPPVRPTSVPAPPLPSSRPLSWPLDPQMRPSRRKYRRLIIRQDRGDVIVTGHLTELVNINQRFLRHGSWIPRPVRESIRPLPRGFGGYCPARQDTGYIPEHGYGDFFPSHGTPCECHGPAPPSRHYYIHPRDWTTTPAEAEEVDVQRLRSIRFNEQVSIDSFEKWYLDAYGEFVGSSDQSTAADDELAIQAIEATEQPAPVNANDFDAIWQAAMDEGFPDDED
ncbi:hypothetical protein ACLMJK_004371 [Lecanora helva]